MALVDMFLKLEGIAGESSQTGHVGEIEIDKYRLGGTTSRDEATNALKSAVRMSHLTLFAKVDLSTPLLFKGLKENRVIPTAKLTCRKAGKEQFDYLVVELSDVLVAKVQIGDLDVGEVVPRCEFDLAYGKLQITAKPQTRLGTMAGSTMFQFDLKTNMP